MSPRHHIHSPRHRGFSPTMHRTDLSSPLAKDRPAFVLPGASTPKAALLLQEPPRLDLSVISEGDLPSPASIDLLEDVLNGELEVRIISFFHLLKEI